METTSSAVLSAVLQLGHNRYPIDSFTGMEVVSKPYRFSLRLYTNQLTQAEKILGHAGQLFLSYSGTVHNTQSRPLSRSISGVITAHQLLNLASDDTSLIEIVLEPRLSVLKFSGQPRVYLNKSALEVVEITLLRHGYERNQLNSRTLKEPVNYRYWAQAQNESDFEFMHRVLAREGIAYFWSTPDEGNSEVLHFVDEFFLHPSMEHDFLLTEENGMIHGDIHSLFKLKQHKNPASYRVTYCDYDTQNPAKIMEAQAGNGKRPVRVWGFGAQTLSHLQQATRHHHERLTMNELVFTAQTHNPFVLTGHIFYIMKLPGWIISNGFHLLKLTHSFNQGCYDNELSFIPKNKSFRPDIIKLDAGHLVHTAVIYSNDDLPYLDMSGQYTYYTHVHNPNGDRESLQQASRLAPYGGPAIGQAMGMHFPLRRQAEVLVMYLHNDLNQPILQNSPSNGLNRAPVTRDNSWSTLLKTAWGQYLELCDRKGQEAITLSNAENHNHLHIQTTQHNNHIYLACERGNVSFLAKKQQALNSKEKTTATIGKDLHIETAQNNLFTANDLHLQAKCHDYSANENLTIATKHSITAAAEAISMKSEGDMAIHATGECIKFHLANGDILWEVDTLEVKAKKFLHFSTQDAGIKLAPSGITMHGMAIQFAGAIIPKAPIADTSTPIPPLMHPALQRPATIKPTRYFTFGVTKIIHSPSWESPFYREEDTAFILVSIKGFTGNETGKVTIIRYHHPARNNKLPNNPKPQQLKEAEQVVTKKFSLGEEYLYPDKKQHLNSPGTATLRIPYLLHELIDAENTEKDALYDPYYAHIEIDNSASHSCSNAMIILTRTDLTLIHDKNRPYQNKQAILSIQRALPECTKAHPHCPTLIESRYYGAPTPVDHLPLGKRNRVQLKEKGIYREILRSDYTLPLSSQHVEVTNDNHHNTTLARLMPPIIFNLREAKMVGENVVFESDTPDSRIHLTEDEKAYIKANGNNITIFIHGYNVDYGAFHPHFTGLETYKALRQTPQPFPTYGEKWTTIKAPDTRATFYRDLDFFRQQFPDINKSALEDMQELKPTKVNGTGLHEWIIHLENNLNKAAGFDGVNYKPFSRCLFIAWPGNPASALDYMDAALESARMGPIVAKVFENLQQQIPEVKLHVIAHSQGNGVLLHALENHAQKHLKPVDHVFFWQAAIPKNALHNKKTAQTNELWFCPNANKGAKKISVLYSKNDNVLGPLLHQVEQPEGVSLKEVWKRKDPLELISAIAAKALSLNSIYTIANWLGVSVSMLFHEDSLAAAWEIWTKKHPTFSCNGKTYSCQKTLEQQKQFLKKENLSDYLKVNYQEKLTQEIRDVFELLKEYTEHDKSLEVAVTVSNHLFSPFFHVLLNLIKSVSTETDLVLTLFFKEFKQLMEHLLTFGQTAIGLNQIHEVPALGYEGVDIEDSFIKQLRYEKKLYVKDTTEWVWWHSDMKIPSEKVLTKIYKKEILTKIIFGKYSIDKSSDAS